MVAFMTLSRQAVRLPNSLWAVLKSITLWVLTNGWSDGLPAFYGLP
jgi:hypothetical protein